MSYTLYGALGSPYSMKMRGVLRYWRTTFVMKSAYGGSGPIAHVRPPVIPVLHTPNDEWLVDSTPMIETLDPELGGARSVLPEDPAASFLSYLFEDMADEWLTKVMFWFRWSNEQDARLFALEGSFDVLGSVGLQQLEGIATAFYNRQVGRMKLVGCAAENGVLLESNLDEMCSLLALQLPDQPFIFGGRPSRADFALYGQLSQLCSDPTSSARIRARSPLVHRWSVQCADLGECEGIWTPPEEPWSPTIVGLAQFCAEIYLPYLAANEEAYSSGVEMLQVQLRDTLFRKPPYRYHVKCLRWLKERYEVGLSLDDGRLLKLSQETGLHRWLS